MKWLNRVASGVASVAIALASSSGVAEEEVVRSGRGEPGSEERGQRVALFDQRAGVTLGGPAIFERYAGQWVVLDRARQRILASGRTFDQAKAMAAHAGEQQVVIARVAGPNATGTAGRLLAYSVNVFVARS